MFKRLFILCLVLLGGLWLLPTAVFGALNTAAPPDQAPPPTHHGGDVVPQGIGLTTSWYGDIAQSLHKGAGIVSYYHLAVFGPHICTSFGDPYSPLNSPWAPGPYTYTYRLRIPADYPSSIVRVELFDPDSMNAATPGTPLTIPRTNAAINAGLDPTTTGNCTTNRKDACQLDTGELGLVNGGVLTLEQINPYYFWRVDENRGAGSPPGNGSCGSPGSYNATYNTQTLFELLYYAEAPGGTIQRQNLSFYTGQVGDGARDNGDHDTDRRWVSPGGAQSFDQPVFVPTDPDSPGNFEVDLTTETPNIIVDPETGDRFLYLNVTTLSGASKNGYDLWAGPPDYVNTVPSDVNDRNLQALNNPGSHSSQGIDIEAVENLLLNHIYPALLDIPLAHIGPEYAGGRLNVSLFDSDNGAQPPITFTMESIAPSDWSLTYGVPGVDDPDGVPAGVRCLPGISCNNQFITPAYTLTLPTEEGCDYGSPDPQTCTPFYGGRLVANYRGGSVDTYLWQVTNLTEPPPNNNPTAGCSTFPIGVYEGLHSVTPPGTGGNPYPTNFDYPNPPPTYEQFINHTPDVPLSSAGNGDVFKIEGGFGQGSFSWLKWNQWANDSASNLQGSLTWPGNSRDYVTIAPGPTPPGFPHAVYGFIEYGDPTDTEMHIGDWIAGNTGAVNSNAVRTALQGHINNGRILRLPVWDQTAGTGSDGRYLTSGFALFRLRGYHMSSGTTWLLAEFIGWDESCGQTAVALDEVAISGPATGLTNTPYTFTATVSPLYATQPITYVWEVSGQAPVTHTGSITNVLTMSWPLTGTYTLTVTAVNANSSPVTDNHTITISHLLPPGRTLYLPILLYQE